MYNQRLSSSACRVCLTTNHRTKIFMSNENGWLDKFRYCFGLQIHLQDQARILCEECAHNLKKFAKFKAKCLKAEQLWQSNIFLDTEYQGTRLEETDKDFQAYSDNLNKSKELSDTQNGSRSVPLDINVYNICDKRQTKLINPAENLNSNTLQENLKQIMPDPSSANSLDRETKQYSTQIKSKRRKICKSQRKLTRKKTKRSCSILNVCQDDVNGSEITCTNEVMPNFDNNIVQFVSVEKELTNPDCKCGKEFGSVKRYEDHAKKCKINKWYYKQIYAWQNCGLCKFSSEDLNVLWKHLDEHFTRNDLECKLCDYTGRDFSEMAYHRFSHLGSTSTLRLYCLVCRQFFRNYRALQFHFRKTHLNKIGALCRFCDIQLKTMHGWRRHEVRSHADILFGKKPLFYCDCCGLKFSCRKTLTDHLRSLAGAFKCVCDKCGQVFARENNLKSHIRNVHSKNEMVKCPECDKTMKSYSLKQHFNITHGEKKISCEVCPKKFPNNLSLRYHMLSHTNARPFECDICSVSYKTASYMKMHKMRAHTADRPYVCSTCAKGFCTKTQLDIHKAVHTKEKPFKCDDCDRSFSYKSTRRIHMEKVHNGK